MAEPKDMSASLAEEILAELHDFRTTMNQRFDAIHQRFDTIDARFDAIDALMVEHLTRFASRKTA